MIPSGVIVEYNPFHNGHLHHINEAKKYCDVLIAVMSGDFLQRGEPACINKYERTKLALKNGADIIIELPVYFSSQAAEVFAFGSVSILNLMKVNSIVFGSESANLKHLNNILDIKYSKEYNELMNKFLLQGVSYSKANNLTLESFNLKISSNDILALEYISSIKKLNLNIKAVPINRIKSQYNSCEITEDIASATAIRSLIYNEDTSTIEKVVPNSSLKTIIKHMDSNNIATLDKFYPLIKYTILTNKSHLKNIQDIEKGLDNRIYNLAIKHCSFNDFFNDLLTKRYSKSRLQRVLIHILLNITTEVTKNALYNIPYLKILGFNSNGRKYLNYLKSINDYNFIVTDKDAKKYLSKENYFLYNINYTSEKIYKLLYNYKNINKPINLA